MKLKNILINIFYISDTGNFYVGGLVIKLASILTGKQPNSRLKTILIQSINSLQPLLLTSKALLDTLTALNNTYSSTLNVTPSAPTTRLTTITLWGRPHIVIIDFYDGTAR